jgi:hypothetical protein
MIKIINKLNQRIMIHLPGGKILNLLTGASVPVSETELASPRLQVFLNKKYIAAVSDARVDPERILSNPDSQGTHPVSESAVHPSASKQTKGTTKGKGRNK